MWFGVIVCDGLGHEMEFRCWDGGFCEEVRELLFAWDVHDIGDAFLVELAGVRRKGNWVPSPDNV